MEVAIYVYSSRDNIAQLASMLIQFGANSVLFSAIHAEEPHVTVDVDEEYVLRQALKMHPFGGDFREERVTIPF